MNRLIWAVVVIAVGLGCMTGEKAMAQDDFLEEILQSHPGLQAVLSQAPEFRLQIVLGLVEKDPEGNPVLRQYSYRAGAEYFYPASTVKLFAAIAAAQKLAALREETDWTLDMDTGLIFHPLFADDELEMEDVDNMETGAITVRQEIREIFLVSDDQAYNYLYELVGQDGLAESLSMAGLDTPRIVHRLSEIRTPEENRQLPKIVLLDRGFKHVIPQRTTDPLPPTEPVDRIIVGRGYYSGEELIEEPMDFSTKNYFPLVDLQRGLCMLVRPDVDCGGPGFALETADREVMLEAMSQYPRKSANPIYDSQEYPDDYVKDLLPGLERVANKKRIRIFNKIGQAYGFSTENAWVVNTATNNGFFLAATLYTNANDILNDDDYEYEEIARPFMADLGEAVASRLWKSQGD